jgi:hypothetical protein
MYKPTISNPTQEVFIDMDFNDEYEPVAAQQFQLQEAPTVHKTV